MHVLAIGNPFDGMSVLGPFEDSEQASAYAEQYRLDEWWTIEVDEPNWIGVETQVNA